MFVRLAKGLCRIAFLALGLAFFLALAAVYSPFNDVYDIMMMTGCETEETCEQLYASSLWMAVRYGLPRFLPWTFALLVAFYLIVMMIKLAIIRKINH